MCMKHPRYAGKQRPRTGNHGGCVDCWIMWLTVNSEEPLLAKDLLRFWTVQQLRERSRRAEDLKNAHALS